MTARLIWAWHCRLWRIDLLAAMAKATLCELYARLTQ
jgi:hypothetical protein